MTDKDQVALHLTTALITADPSILKGTDPQMMDRRIKTAIELFSKVSAALNKKPNADPVG